jgi:hypothetical protein
VLLLYNQLVAQAKACITPGFRFYQHNQCGISWHSPCIQSCLIVLPSESARTTSKCTLCARTEAIRIFHLMLRLPNLLKSFQIIWPLQMMQQLKQKRGKWCDMRWLFLVGKQLLRRSF